MLKVLGLRKIVNTDPQEYELRWHDLENKKPGYEQTTVTGTEAVLRPMLKNGGMTEASIDILFMRAA